MNNKGVYIRYGDVAPEAKENFVPTASEIQFDTIGQLQQYNLNFPNYANPCELYSVILDGEAQVFPSEIENKNIGLWSEQISDENGLFLNPIVLTLESLGNYSSSGFTFTFDKYNNIYPTHLNIHWYRNVDGEIVDLGEEDFYPDNSTYSCKKRVDVFNKVVISFTKINMPYNRLKLRVIDYGYGTFFYSNELRNVKLIQEIDPISSNISINTVDFTIDSKSESDYSFQEKQPLTVYFNGKLKATTFVKNSKRKTRNLWQIQGEDYIGLMDSIPYYGGMYNGYDAYDLLVDIFTAAKIPYKINPLLKGILLYGHIPYTTCRSALLQVCFAVQNVADTSEIEEVSVHELDSEIKQKISLNRIIQGQNFVDDETVTGVEVAVHSYKPITKTVDVYDANESGIGQNIFVKFSEPLHSLSITNGTFAVDEKGNELKNTNYAVINANVGCVLRGQQYEHTTQTRKKNNPLVLASDIEKVVSIENATLVSSNNIDNVLEKCYNWLVKTKTINLKIVEARHISGDEIYRYGEAKYGLIKYGQKTEKIITYDNPVSVGDVITSETEYLGDITGRIIKQTFNLNGGTIIKEAVLR